MSKTKTMTLFLSAIQGLMALFLITIGIFKLTKPKHLLATQLSWVNDFSLLTVRLIGFSELLMGVGFVLPLFIHQLAWVVPIAAGSLCILMLMAAGHHFLKKEFAAIRINVTILFIAILLICQNYFL